MTGIYLRDLSENNQAEFMRNISQEVREKVMKALAEDYDIEIGQYYPHNKVKVIK